MLRFSHLVSLLLREVSHTFQLYEDLVMRIWAAYWISYDHTKKWVSLEHKLNLTNQSEVWLRAVWAWSYPWCRSQRNNSLLAERLATEKLLSSENRGTTPRTPSPLGRSTSDPVWQRMKRNIPPCCLFYKLDLLYITYIRRSTVSKCTCIETRQRDTGCGIRLLSQCLRCDICNTAKTTVITESEHASRLYITLEMLLTRIDRVQSSETTPQHRWHKAIIQHFL